MWRPKTVFAGMVSVVLLALGVTSGTASSPPGAVTVPTTAGQTATDAWTGTVAPGVNVASDCSPPSTSPVDEHDIAVSVAPGTYDTIDATFTFTITWSPVVDATANDLILTVIGPDGSEVGSSDGGSPAEKVVGNNLPAGTYKVLACGFANSTSQSYNGKLEVTTTARSAETSLPSAPANGLAFSASVAADNQRDEAEPLLEIDRDGNVYDCGPTGFSNTADYAQVSTDGGDQFHLLGTPPRGQQGIGGGGDCGLATGVARNTNVPPKFQYAYAGLGPLTGFTTSTSPDNGHRIANAGPNGNGLPGATNQGGLADRQWMTFVDDKTVLLSYNQQVPRNTVVQKSTDGGLTYGPTAVRAARNPRFPGPLRYDQAHDVVFFAWDRGAADGDHINLSISKDKGATWTDCLAAVAPANGTPFTVADNDSAGNIYIVYGEQAKFHTYMVSLPAAKVAGCNEDLNASSRLPVTNPGFSAPVQVDRDAVRTTVFPWAVAGGAPGRLAVVFAGTETDGNPNSGNFKASWDIYVNQSLNANSTDPLNPPTFSQVKATTHPFHFDSICLNGLGCDLSVPPGDRSLADFISIDVNPVDGKLYVTFDRANKKPDESGGHVASPMVVTQTAGPSNSGGTLAPSPRAVVRTSSTDPTGDALSSYSLMSAAVLPPAPPTQNEPAGDLTSVSIGPELDLLDNTPVANGGFTATIKVADLSTASLLATLARTQAQSLLWVLRFTNGYQDAAASVRWNPVQGFTFGYNDYTLGARPCETVPGGVDEKCVVYPGDAPIEGDVDQLSGTIRLSVPRFLLRALSGPAGPGQRPVEVGATVGSRFYDATVFSLGNTVSPLQKLQSFLYPLDNTPAMDFLLPAPGAVGPPLPGCKATGGGTIPGAGGTDGKFSLNVRAGPPPKGRVAYRDGSTDFLSGSITEVSCPDSAHAHIVGTGKNNGGDVSFTVDVTDAGEAGTSDVFTLTMSSGGTRSGTLTRGNIQVHS